MFIWGHLKVCCTLLSSVPASPNLTSHPQGSSEEEIYSKHLSFLSPLSSQASLASNPGLPPHLPSSPLPPAPALSTEDLLTPSLPLTTSLLGLLGELAYPCHPWLSSCLSQSLLRSVPTSSSSYHSHPQDLPGSSCRVCPVLPAGSVEGERGRQGCHGLPQGSGTRQGAGRALPLLLSALLAGLPPLLLPSC